MMKLTNEMKIGILVCIVTAILLVLTWQAGDFDFSVKGYELKVQFENIEGVDVNAPVRFNGLEVGSVKDIRIVYDPEKTLMELTVWVREDVKIRQGARAFVKTMGFMGEKYVGLSAGDPQQPFLQPKAVILGEQPADLQKILADGEVIAQNLKEISVELNERSRINSETIDEIFAKTRQTMGNAAAITDNVRARLELNEHLIDDFVQNLNATSQNLEELSYDLKENPWKLLYKPKEKRKRE